MDASVPRRGLLALISAGSGKPIAIDGDSLTSGSAATQGSSAAISGLEYRHFRHLTREQAGLATGIHQ